MTVTDVLRQLAEAGATHVYPCPCQAEGRLVEVEPMVFVISYGHDDWCPVLTALADVDPPQRRKP
jgi:hypothetical protein